MLRPLASLRLPRRPAHARRRERVRTRAGPLIGHLNLISNLWLSGSLFEDSRVISVLKVAIE